MTRFAPPFAVLAAQRHWGRFQWPGMLPGWHDYTIMGSATWPDRPDRWPGTASPLANWTGIGGPIRW